MTKYDLASELKNCKSSMSEIAILAKE